MARGPGYPAIGLTAAIEKAREWYDRDGTAPVAPTVVVEAWGYTSLNGTSYRVLAALKYYGLLEYVGDDARLTDRALAILLEDADSEEHGEAILDAASEPDLFQTLLSDYQDRLPSDLAIATALIRKHGFKGQSAQKAVAAFRETAELAKQYESRHIPPIKEKRGGGGDEGRKDRHTPPPTFEGLGGRMEFKWWLSGDAAATLTVSKQLDLDDIDTLADCLEIAKKALRKAAKSAEMVASSPEAG